MRIRTETNMLEDGSEENHIMSELTAAPASPGLETIRVQLPDGSIREVAAQSAHPERLGALLTLVEDELGYQLYQIVSTAKAALSRADSAVLSFHHKDIHIEETITRADFENWIAPELKRLATTVDAALAQAGMQSGDIDHVFLTGGTSFVPAVRQLFDRQFGAAKVSSGGEFVSVAEGLALIGRDRLG